MNKTTLTFYGGLRSIGGTIVSLQYGSDRVIFDFGLVYSPQTNILDGQIQVRESAMTRDYLTLELIPKIDGIYHEASLPIGSSLIPANHYQGNTAILISHLHLDHIGGMGFIDPSIPVFMSKESHDLYQTLELIGERVNGDRIYESCEYDKPFFVGEIKITPLQVDHDIPGACGFHIETPDGAVVYTGDLRLHGNHPERVESFITKAKTLGFDVVIIEGTTLRSEEELPEELLVANRDIPAELITEPKVPKVMAELLHDKQGIGIFNIYHRNIDRIAGLLQAGQLLNRKVVFEIGTAQLAANLLNKASFYIYESESLRLLRENNQLQDWQIKLFNTYPSLSAQVINESPHEYLLQNSYDQALELFDLNTEKGLYFHSDGVPLGDYDPAFHNLKRILDHLGLAKVAVGTGGHALPQHLQYIVEELDPNVLIPLHSFHPERLTPKRGIQLLPQYGKTYILQNGALVELVEEDI
ncbi:MBL fold metallo-hydrolase [Ornithinibacillus sp. FSL M8-0202]|uniref:MBL fold metallo-hydrolase n=1 Tax=Ornithinibacillus sp. FSL M8-0202 TaxID=2921616 RepID=UPI0030D0EFBE